MAQTTSANAINTPFVDLKTGMVTWTWLKIIDIWRQQLAGGFDPSGNLKSNIEPAVGIVGRNGTIGSILQHIDEFGVVQPDGMSSATDALQGAVVLPSGASSNVLGSAAMEPSSAFDPAGSAAIAQSNAETFATNAANTAQSNAEATAAAALSGAFSAGISVTVTTAALTALGAQGSMTFTNGLLTAQVQAT